jgi:carnitine 3-dehydrogenase
MTEIRTLGLLGTGVIGAGWAARALHYGVDVVAYDPNPKMEDWLRGTVDAAMQPLSKLTMAPLPKRGSLRFTTDAAEMIAAADFIQESIPENLDLKQKVLRELSATIPPDVIIASSTSGFMPSDLQDGITAPDRLVIGHPFNPVYLLPLCEIVGGRETSDTALRIADGFYEHIGMHCLHVKKEIPGHISDRLQEALWREILHIVDRDAASTGDIDDAICYGPGLRWAIMGTNMIFTLAGGQNGMRHFFEQFGPALELPWTDLKAPPLTEELIDKMVAGVEAQQGTRSIRDWERIRDDCLVAIQQVLRTHDQGAGRTLKAIEQRLYAEVGATAAADEIDIAQPLRLHEGDITPDVIDYNNHLTEWGFFKLISDASDKLFRFIGIDQDYRESGRTFFTVETHIGFLGEGKLGDAFHVTTQILDVDAKRLRFMHTLVNSATGDPMAEIEQMLLHVDTAAGKAAPIDAAVKAKLDAVAAAHAKLPRPASAGRGIGAPRA